MQRSRIQRPTPCSPRRPPLDAQQPRADVDGADHQAEDRVVGVAERRPGHDDSGERRVAQPFGTLQRGAGTKKRRQRSGGHQAEVAGGRAATISGAHAKTRPASQASAVAPR